MGRSYFRKSKKLGPIRLSASKSGISYSVGGKGARITKRTDGKVQSTVGVPGSGLRRTSVHGAGRSSPKKKGPAISQASKVASSTRQVRTSLSGWSMVGIFFGAFIIANPLASGLFGEDAGSTVAFFLSLGAVVGGAIWYRNRQAEKVRLLEAERQRRLEAERQQREELARIRPQPRLFKSTEEAEQLACEWVRYFGFPDAKVTDPGPDGGIDVEASNAVAQVKTNAQKIGRPVVQQTFGAAAATGRRAIVFALSGFSADAESWASGNDVALFEFDHAGGVEPVNSTAQRMMDEGDRRRLG